MFNKTPRRVVVTGLGLITPLGLNVRDTWASILEGKSGVKLIEHFDVSSCSVKIASFVENFDPAPFLDYKEVRKHLIDDLSLTLSN